MLTRRQARRDYGLTIPKLVKLARDIKEEGEIDMDDHGALAGALAARVPLKGVDASNYGAVDWDAILEFIENLIPLILRIIEALS